MSGKVEDPKEGLREIIEALKAGKKPDELKEKFRKILGEVESGELSMIEDSLVKEGIPIVDVERLCDVHMAVSRESVEREKAYLSAGHPIHILLEEHKFVRDVAEEIGRLLPAFRNANSAAEASDVLRRLGELLGHMKEYDKHKVREENALFPFIEKHGVTQPPAVMWSEHDVQRKHIKEAAAALKKEELAKVKEKAMPNLQALVELVPNHFYKEENILFPTALRLISVEEWREIKDSMDDLGYCYFTPAEAIGPMRESRKEATRKGIEVLLDTGSFAVKQLEAVLNSLPVDITFVDSEDTVRYFNQAPDRIFPRTKAIIGRKVQKCHPAKSVDVVERILSDFRSGARSSAAFWLRLGEKYVRIQYFALRGKEGEYLGCLEVSQDIAPIQRIQGEKRLLD